MTLVPTKHPITKIIILLIKNVKIYITQIIRISLINLQINISLINLPIKATILTKINFQPVHRTKDDTVIKIPHKNVIQNQQAVRIQKETLVYLASCVYLYKCRICVPSQKSLLVSDTALI